MIPQFDNAIRSARTALIALAFIIMPAGAQDYGDTPYVQTPQNVVDRMLEVAKVGSKDFVIDLGSGDGRMIITAAKKHGARGFGVDLDRRLVTLSNRLAAKAGVSDRAVFYERDIYQTDLSPASVVTIYLLPEVNLMMRPRLIALLKPGTRVVSHDYDMGEWTPDLAFTMDAPGKTVGRDEKSKVFFWVVPAKVSGKWRWYDREGTGPQRSYELVLEQFFQKIEGTLSIDGKPVPIQNAKLTGEEVSFSAMIDPAAPTEFTGRVINNAMEGVVRTGGASAKPAPWSAARTDVWDPKHLSLPPPTLIPPSPQ
jgi:Ribosomal protein L11 methyltransferase (PrmA)